MKKKKEKNLSAYKWDTKHFLMAAESDTGPDWSSD